MRLDIVTVFPEMIASALDHSIVKRARERGLMDIRVINLRDYTTDRHRTTDDLPYGGGGGMVMKIEPIARALESLTRSIGENTVSGANAGHNADQESSAANLRGAAVEVETTLAGVPSERLDAVAVSETPRPRIILTDPRGERFTQETARRWAQEAHLILLCGHYEGVDERVRQHLVTDEVSVGDYILTGGELPALLIADALTRLQPGALGDEQGAQNDTFTENLLEYPHYTRPAEFRGWRVPEMLLSGHHALIEKWRRWHQLRATRERRPDLFARLQLSKADEKLLSGEEPTAPSDPKAAAKTAPIGISDAPQADNLREPEGA